VPGVGGRTELFDVEDIGLALSAASGNMAKAARKLGTSAPLIAAYVKRYPELEVLTRSKALRSDKKMPDSREESIILSIQKHRGILSLVCEELGFSAPAAIEYHIRTNAAVREAYTSSTGKVLDRAQTNIYDAVEDGDLKQSNWLLDRLGKDRGFTTRSEIDKRVEHVHSVDGASTDSLLAALQGKVSSGELEISEADFEVVCEDIEALAESPDTSTVGEIIADHAEEVTEEVTEEVSSPPDEEFAETLTQMNLFND